MTAAPPPPRRRIPLWVKVFCTLFLFVLVPVYWADYGPANFLWFCDAGLVVTTIGLWLESPLLISMSAVALAAPQGVWAIDFLSGGRLLGISDYMFNPDLPLFIRFLSTFHLWLPILLVWLTWRIGYDRRAAVFQSLLLVALLVASYLLTDPRRPPRGYPNAAVNVNRVYGIGTTEVQTRMPPLVFLGLEILFYLGCVYLRTHLVFRKLFPPPGRTIAPPGPHLIPAGAGDNVVHPRPSTQVD